MKKFMRNFLKFFWVLAPLGSYVELSGKPLVPVEAVTQSIILESPAISPIEAKPMALKQKTATTSSPFQVKDVFFQKAKFFGMSREPMTRRYITSNLSSWSFDHAGASFMTFIYRKNLMVSHVDIRGLNNVSFETELLLQDLGLSGHYRGTTNLRYYQLEEYPRGYVRVLVSGSPFQTNRLIIDYIDNKERPVIGQSIPL